MHHQGVSGTAAHHGGARSVTAVLAAATAVGSLGLGAGGTAGALVAVDITGRQATAGWPLAVLVVGQALGALLISFGTRLTGRRLALAAGYVTGAVGALVVVLAGELRSFPAILAGSLLLGAANAAVMLTRYAVVDVTDPAVRGRALGTVFGATAFGAVGGVVVLGPSAAAAAALGVSGYLGLYLLAILAFLTAATLLSVGHSSRAANPGPERRQPRPTPPADGDRDGGTAGAEIPGRAHDAWTPLGLLAATNLAMTAIMVVAPVHLHAHGITLETIGAITALHVLLMFGPSPLTGRLADRAGGLTVAAVGLGLLAVAAVAGSVVDASAPWAAAGFLAVLGLGWNAGVVGGSALLAMSLSARERSRAEGYGETAMGVAAAVGSPAAGLLVAGGGFGLLCLSVAVAGATAAAVAALARADRHRIDAHHLDAHRADSHQPDQPQPDQPQPDQPQPDQPQADHPRADQHHPDRKQADRDGDAGSPPREPTTRRPGRRR